MTGRRCVAPAGREDRKRRWRSNSEAFACTSAALARFEKTVRRAGETPAPRPPALLCAFSRPAGESSSALTGSAGVPPAG
jgi:hypothetical protein